MAIALRAHNLGDSAAAAGSQTVSITSTTSGDLATVVASVAGNTSIAVSDNGASHATWVTLLAATYDATLDRTRAVFAAYNIPAAITTMTVTYGASSANRTTHVATWSGAASSAAFDQGPASQTQTSTTPTSGTVTPSQDNELILGVGLATGSFLTTPAGFTTNDGSTTASFMKTQRAIQTTATAVAASFTCASEYVICDVFTFATSPVGGSTPVSDSDAGTLSESASLATPATDTDTATLDDRILGTVQAVGTDPASVVDVDTTLLVQEASIPEAVLDESASVVAVLQPQTESAALTELGAVTVNGTTVSDADTAAINDFLKSLSAAVTGPEAFSLTEVGSVLTVGGLTVAGTESLSFTETATINVLSVRYALATLSITERMQGSLTATPRLPGTLAVHP
jgi:hypothetical protein